MFKRLTVAALAAASLIATPGSAEAYATGHDALKDKPFVTGIRIVGTKNFFCTGTLLQASYVLTAAHCLDEGRTAAQVEVVIGETNLDDSTDPVQVRYAAQLVVHPKWNGDFADGNDVALIRLQAPSTIAPVRLGTPPALTAGIQSCISRFRFQPAYAAACESGRGKALGWGRTSMSAPTTTNVLREVTPRIFGWVQNSYWRVKSGACPGDSGGPLLALAADGSPRQIGIASNATNGGGYVDFLYGDACSTRSYDYYSDVSAGPLRTWVESITRVRDHRA